jgi:signal transduction histidine kinase
VASGHADRIEAELTGGLDRIRGFLAARERIARDTADRIAAEIRDRRLLDSGGPLLRAELFRRLADDPTPDEVTGIFVHDAASRPIAWTGRTDPEGEVLEGRAKISQDGVRLGSVTAFAPLFGRTPFGGESADAFAERFDLAEVVIRTDPDAGPAPGRSGHRLTGIYRDAAGDTVASITVAIFPLDARLARIDHRRRGIRAALLTVLLAAAAWAVGRRALAEPAGWKNVGLFLLVIVAARIGAHLAGFPGIVFTGDEFDPASFSYPIEPFGIDTGLLNSPADFALSAFLLLLAVGVTLAALARRALPFAGQTGPGALLAVVAVAATGILTAAWQGFLHLLPWYSTVEFFSEQSVLPEMPAALLLLGAFLVALTLLAVTSVLLLVPARILSRGSTGRRTAVIVGLSIPVALAIHLATDLSPALSSIAAASIASSTLVTAAWPSPGFGIRIAALAALATVLTFPPFIREVWLERRNSVEEQATDLFEIAPEAPLAERLSDDIEEIAGDETLVELLEDDPERPRPKLAYRLWVNGPLARRARGSDLRILARSGNRVLSRFGIDMPPADWLPDPLPGRTTEIPHVEPQVGREGGIRQRFLVGTAPVKSDDGEFLGEVVVRMPIERPLLEQPRRPEILRSLVEGSEAEVVRELHYAEYDGDRLSMTTNPEYPLVHRTPDVVAQAILVEGRPRFWHREPIGPAFWINLYRPRVEDGRIVGMRSVGFRSSEQRDLFLSAFKMLLVNTIAAAIAALVALLWRFRRFRPRFQHKLLASYLVVSAIPVLLLAQVNRSVARETVEAQMQGSLTRAMRQVRGELRDRGILSGLVTAVGNGATREDIAGRVTDEDLKEISYRLGQEINLYVTRAAEERGGPLVASSEPGLVATGLFSQRLSGHAWLESVLLGREFASVHEKIGAYSFLVGYSPITSEDGVAVGAVGLPMIYGQDAVDRELARRNSLILALYLLILLVVVFIGMVLARRISSPIERLAEGTRRLSAGDLSYRIPQESHDEFGYLVESFNRMTEDLSLSRERIVKAEKDAAWREMAKQIAHEIKNPLTPMRLSAQHILRAFEDGHEEFEEIFVRGLETIIRQTESLRRIASEFSAFARLPARRLAAVDPAAITREVAGLFASAENVTISEMIEETPTVLADREELKRVVVNLAANAVQAMKKDGGRLSLRTSVETTRFDGTERPLVSIAVTDEGVGIPAEDMGKLFEPNFSTKTGGTGLGLAISKAVVESFGGEIGVVSEVGRGTTVTIRIPVSEADDSA